VCQDGKVSRRLGQGGDLGQVLPDDLGGGHVGVAVRGVSEVGLPAQRVHRPDDELEPAASQRRGCLRVPVRVAQLHPGCDLQPAGEL
jgi:hypothetical protein